MSDGLAVSRRLALSPVFRTLTARRQSWPWLPLLQSSFGRKRTVDNLKQEITKEQTLKERNCREQSFWTIFPFGKPSTTCFACGVCVAVAAPGLGVWVPSSRDD